MSDIKDWLKNLRQGDEDSGHPAQDAYNGQEQEEDAAMAEGVEDSAYGLKRKAIYAVVGVIVVAFTSFTWFSSMGDDESAQKHDKQVEQEANLNQHNSRDKGKLPNDYEQMNKMNEQRKLANNGQQNQPDGTAQNGTAKNNSNGTQPQNKNPQQTYQPPANNTLPAIPPRPYSTAYTPTYMAAAPQGQVNNAAVPSVDQRQKEKEKYSAAIDFGIVKDVAEGNANNGNAPAVQSAGVDNAAVSPTTYSSPASISGGAMPVQSLMAGGAAYMAPMPNSIQAGTVIPAVLLTGINTDVGGQVIAQVSSDVYDSLTGQQLLIPAGSRLVGTVPAGAKDTQKRVNVSWNYLMMPDGGSYSLNGSMVAADYGGYAGIPGRVNHHTGTMLRSGFLSSVLAALGSVAAGNTNSSSNTYSAGQLAAQGAMANMMNSASALFKRGMDAAQTTITVEPGSEFVAYVTQNIQLNPYQGYALY